MLYQDCYCLYFAQATFFLSFIYSFLSSSLSQFLFFSELLDNILHVLPKYFSV